MLNRLRHNLVLSILVTLMLELLLKPVLLKYHLNPISTLSEQHNYGTNCPNIAWNLNVKHLALLYLQKYTQTSAYIFGLGAGAATGAAGRIAPPPLMMSTACLPLSNISLPLSINPLA